MRVCGSNLVKRAIKPMHRRFSHLQYFHRDQRSFGIKMSVKRASASSSSSIASGSSVKCSTSCAHDDDGDSRKGSASDTSSESVTSLTCLSRSTCDICALMPPSSAFATHHKSCSNGEGSCQPVEQKTIEALGRYRRPNQHAPVGCQRVYLVRCAHRLDDTDPDWIELSRLNQDTYIPISLDFPIKLPRRRNNCQDYACDPPLSEFGQLTGQIVGRELRLQGADIRHIFTSPALSCVQTAVAIIKGYRTDGVNICVEPGLDDYPTSNSLMTPYELRAVGYPIDVNYWPQFAGEKNEPTQQQYERIGSVVRSILERVEEHDDSRGSTLVVANALAVDAMCRSLQKRGLLMAPTSQAVLDGHYPACGALALERMSDESAYSIVADAVRPITHLNTTNAVNLDFAERV